MKTKWILFSQFLLSALYLFTLIFSDAIADYVLSLHHIVAGIIILLSIKTHHKFRINWYILASVPILMGIGSSIPSITYYLHKASIILLLIVIINYFAISVKRWHRIQLILDIIVMMIMVLGLASALIFSKMPSFDLNSRQWMTMITVMVVDLLTLLMILILISSSRLRSIPLGLHMIVTGIWFFVAHDMILVYNEFAAVEQLDNIYGSVARIVALSLFAVGSAMKTPQVPLKDGITKKGAPENFQKTKLAIFLIIIPMALYFLGFINLSHFAIIAVSIIFYQLLSFYVQKTAIMEILIEQDQFMRDKLEALVDDRTLELTKANEALYNKSTKDDLTGLYNRNYFIQLLEDQIHLENNHFSVFFMDLDRFKIINDLHGHDMGDKVLTIIADRFKAGVCKNCSYARVGGDEFAILYKDDDPDSLEQLSQHVLDMLSDPIIIDDFQFYVGISIGIARFPKEALTVKQLLKYADIAMYHAKSDEKADKYVLYSSHLIEKIERRNYIELLLREANFEKDFELYYQPKFDTSTHRLIGMEALIRWYHKDEGFISPAEFIPIAEETGIILKLSDWIFATAMARIKVINTLYDKDLVMSINVSPLSLDSISFLPNLRNLIKKIQVSPEWIELEITEHSAMNTATRMEELFTAISGLGVQISIDDFGTGYSSLNYIKRFDIDVLKIAKELIDHIETDDNDRLIVNAIVMMAKGMGLKTIAEGVETEGQLRILEELKCDAIQGYVLGRPVPAQVFEHHYLSDGR